MQTITSWCEMILSPPLSQKPLRRRLTLRRGQAPGSQHAVRGVGTVGGPHVRVQTGAGGHVRGQGVVHGSAVGGLAVPRVGAERRGINVRRAGGRGQAEVTERMQGAENQSTARLRAAAARPASRWR